MAIERVRISGSGGQGAQLLGNMILYSGNADGRNVVFLPSYGPESRGGTSNCHVIVSEGEEIGSPIVDEPTHLIVMNLPSLRKFEGIVENNGFLIYDSSLIDEKPKRRGVQLLGIPAAQIASDLGDSKVINMVLLGAYLAVSKLVSKTAVVDKVFPVQFEGKKKKFIPINKKAIDAGMKAAQEVLK